MRQIDCNQYTDCFMHFLFFPDAHAPCHLCQWRTYALLSFQNNPITWCKKQLFSFAAYRQRIYCRLFLGYREKVDFEMGCLDMVFPDMLVCHEYRAALFLWYHWGNHSCFDQFIYSKEIQPTSEGCTGGLGNKGYWEFNARIVRDFQGIEGCFTNNCILRHID